MSDYLEAEQICLSFSYSLQPFEQGSGALIKICSSLSPSF